MRQRSETSFPLLSFIIGVIAIACNFLSGFLVGLVAPLAASSSVLNSGVAPNSVMLASRCAPLMPLENA